MSNYPNNKRGRKGASAMISPWAQVRREWRLIICIWAARFLIFALPSARSSDALIVALGVWARDAAQEDFDRRKVL